MSTEKATAAALLGLPVPQGPAWLTERRREAKARALALGLPTKRDERWRFTDIRPIAAAPIAAAARKPAGAVLEDRIAPGQLGPDDAHRLVFVDGFFAEGLSDVADLPDGARVESIQSAIARGSGRIEAALGKTLARDTEVFWHLSLAAFTDGAYVGLDKGVELSRPVEIVFVSTGTRAHEASALRSLIELEPHSKATVIERFVCLEPEEVLTLAATEVRVGEGASLTHVKLQHEAREAFHLYALGGEVLKDGRFEQLQIALGARIDRTDLEVKLAAPGAVCRLDGIVAAGGEQLSDTHTTIDHAEPSCNSFEVYKTILGGRARGVFNGKVLVQQDAQKTDAKQTNRTLLLSEHAVIDTKPELEIFADDVKCTHGATVGQLDDEALFYLRARGIDEATARRLLTHAFAEDLLGEVSDEGLRARLRAALDRALEPLIEEAEKG